MDAFFASVEQLDHPEWRGKPLVVGGDSPRSVVAAASYEARAFGIRSAMPMLQAKKLCDRLIVAPGSYARYSELSAVVMGVLDGYAPLVQQASIDEAYADITGAEKLFGPPWELARRLKADILAATGLTCSVGVAPIKFAAKIASDRNKPDGVCIVEDEELPGFLKTLPVKEVPGVGPRAQEKLKALGVTVCGDVLRYERAFWEARLGQWGGLLYDRACGLDPGEVRPHTAAKSDSAENTFHEDTWDKGLLKQWLQLQAERVAKALAKAGNKGRTVTLKIKYSDHRSITRSRTLETPTRASATIFAEACALLDALRLEKPVRLVGVGVGNFGEAPPAQLSLFADDEAMTRAGEEAAERLDDAVAALRERFGKDAVLRGSVFELKRREERR